MKTAILIMAHDQPKHLGKLVEFLNCGWTRIFIHIDRKVDIAEFQKYIPEEKGVIFLDDAFRVSVHWGGFSQVEATLNLLKVSLDFGEHFDRFCFLSGSDYPIRSLGEIKSAFDSKKEFMSIERRLDASSKHSHYKNIRYLHLLDFPILNIMNRLIKKMTGIEPKIRRKMYKKINLYHGSAYWSLTADCIKFIFDFLQVNRGYIRFLRFTKSSDEIFFHSIVKHSPFAGNLSHDFEKNTYFEKNNIHGCHYIDWTAKGIPLPKVLDLSDMDNLLQSKALFARKFREGTSEELLSLVQKVTHAT